MQPGTDVRNVFNSGEWSPSLFGRNDLKKYDNAAAELTNYAVLRHGGLTRRPGTKFIAEVKDSTKATRLIPFRVSTTQNYMLEFGEEYIRIYRNQGRLADATPDVAATATITITAVGELNNGDKVNLPATDGPNHDFTCGDPQDSATGTWSAATSNEVTATNLMNVINTTSNPDVGDRFTATVDGAVVTVTQAESGAGGNTGIVLTDSGTAGMSKTDFTGGATYDDPTEVVSPYAATDLAKIKYFQSADTLFLLHPDWAPRALVRGAGNDALVSTWTLRVGLRADPGATGPEDLAPNHDPIMTTAQSGQGSIAIAWSSHDAGAEFTITATADFFVSTDGPSGSGAKLNHGRKIAVQNAQNKWCLFEITEYVSATQVKMRTSGYTAGENTAAQTDTKNWRIGSWSDTTGWPSVGTFHQERLWLAATASQPQTFWASRVGSYHNFTDFDVDGGAVQANYALNFTISSNEVNKVEGLHSGTRGLLMMTSGGEWLLQGGGSGTAAITPDSVGIVRQSTYGCDAACMQQHVGNSVIFPQPDGLQIREYTFRYDLDVFVAPDLTILSSHITKSGVIDSAYQQEPESIVWFLRNNGDLIGMTYEREEEVIAWHRHFHGGNGSGESIATIRQDSKDELWMITRRTINGVTRRYVEILQPFWYPGDSQEGAFYVDSGLTYAGPGTTTLSGLDHLEGKAVVANANGAAHGPVQVVGGAITLDYEVTTASVGLAYTSTMKTTPLVPKTYRMDTRGKLQRAYKLIVHFFESMGLEIGNDGDPFNKHSPILFRTPQDAMDEAIPLFTGTKDFNFSMSDNRLPQIEIRTTTPLPSNILQLVAEFSIGGV